MVNIRKLESELWESADLLRAGSKLTSNQYCMPVLGLIFLRYAYSRFKKVEAQILQGRPSRGGRVLPVEASDFAAKSALFLPKEAQYDYLVNLPEQIAAAGLVSKDGHPMNSLGEVVNNAMRLIEDQSEQLRGVLPKTYTDFRDDLLAELLRIFNNSALDEVGGDVIGRIYEYFLNKFAKNIAQDDGVFFTPKSLVKMIVNILEPKSGILLDPACGSGGMFVQSGDFVNASGLNANSAMTFYGQEKVEYIAQLCLMNMAVHGLTGVIKSGDEANTFYHDAHSLAGCCDYVMANPPFNVDKVKSESCQSAGRLPFGLPAVNKNKEFGNANYLWISYFYAYLNERGRAGFVMASSATDSQGKDKDIREALVKTGHVDVMISVGNNFFYTKSLPCTLWFFDKGKPEGRKEKVLFLDARNYYTVVDRTLNEWTEWQLKNLSAIVWLYRGETEKYNLLCEEYVSSIKRQLQFAFQQGAILGKYVDGKYAIPFSAELLSALKDSEHAIKLTDYYSLSDDLEKAKTIAESQIDEWAAHISAMEREAKKDFLNSKNVRTVAEYKRGLAVDLGYFCDSIENVLKTIEEAKWLTDKFCDGVYQDIPGLCKIAYTTKEAQGEDKGGVSIEDKGWSLTPGAYVGVTPTKDDGVDFAQRMREIHAELLALQEESNEMMKTISKNMEEMGL